MFAVHDSLRCVKAFSVSRLAEYKSFSSVNASLSKSSSVSCRSSTHERSSRSSRSAGVAAAGILGWQEGVAVAVAGAGVGVVVAAAAVILVVVHIVVCRG